MAATATTIKAAFQPQFITVTEITLDSSYESEGEKVTAEQLGLGSVDHAICNIIQGDEAKTAEQFVGEAFYKGGKIHLIDAKTGKEVAGTGNMEKVKIWVTAFGKSRAK